jgi:hypothetical protein
MFFPAGELLVGDIVRLPLRSVENSYCSEVDAAITAVRAGHGLVTLQARCVALADLARGSFASEATLSADEPIMVFCAQQSRPICRWTRFITESGSEYLIDHDERVWWRATGPRAAETRTANGIFWRCSPVREHRSVTLVCPPVVCHAIARIVRSTPVQHIAYR